MFHDPTTYAFAAVLEKNWRAIHDEYLGIKGELVDWMEKQFYGEGWRVFGLFDFPRGEILVANARQCPLTVSLVREHLPRHGAVGFSVLAPGTRIAEHLGYPGPFLRCHLALEVPVGDCVLNVRGESRAWQAGKVLLFDDRVPHEAWNLADADRVVLLVDFIPDR